MRWAFQLTSIDKYLTKPLAIATPLWHGVELTRGAALGIATELSWYVHVGYLALMAAVGTRMSITGFDKRLRQ